MKILYLLAENEQTLNDRLLVGLVELGYKINESIIVFPYKYSLFGNCDHKSYFGLPNCNTNVPDITGKLENGFFDLVFLSDIYWYPYYLGLFDHIMSFIKDTPCVIIQEGGAIWSETCPYKNLNIIAHFSQYVPKDAGLPLLPITFPLQEKEIGSAEKEYDVFFAGLSSPHRMQYLQKLIDHGYENIYPYHIDDTRSGYCARLRKARVGLSISRSRGSTLNTFRPVEVAGSGSCAFIENWEDEIIWPHPFTHNENAIIYNSPDDMLEKLQDILSDEERLKEISRKGQEHVINHFLCHVVAKEVMDIVIERMNK